MPKNKCATIHVNKMVFMYVLKKKKSSIRKLGMESSVGCSEKTIRRQLNNEEMRDQYVERIAKFLNVDPRLLTGELVKKAFETTDNETDNEKELRKLYLQPLNYIEDYPYFCEENRYYSTRIDEVLHPLLTILNISFEQYENKTEDQKYEFQHDLFSAVRTVIYKHFTENGYGGPLGSRPTVIDWIELEKEDRDIYKYADSILREKYCNNPPKGFSKKAIEKMSAYDLICLDQSLVLELSESTEDEKEDPVDDYIRKKYGPIED